MRGLSKPLFNVQYILLIVLNLERSGTEKMKNKWKLYSETFDDYRAIINGFRREGYRLTIFQRRADPRPGELKSIIVYQEDSNRCNRLKARIGDFRYGLIEVTY